MVAVGGMAVEPQLLCGVIASESPGLWLSALPQPPPFGLLLFVGGYNLFKPRDKYCSGNIYGLLAVLFKIPQGNRN